MKKEEIGRSKDMKERKDVMRGEMMKNIRRKEKK